MPPYLYQSFAGYAPAFPNLSLLPHMLGAHMPMPFLVGYSILTTLSSFIPSLLGLVAVAWILTYQILSLLGKTRHPSMPPIPLIISKTGFLRDNGGAISGNIFNIGATNSTREYRDYLKKSRAEHLPLHPAIMPVELARKCISFTTRPGDLVVDPMGGSLTTAVAAEQLGRRWICSDISLGYLAGARHRFPERKENAPLLEEYLSLLPQESA